MTIKKRSIMAANDPQVSSVKFNFKEYKAENAPFHNNSTDIDFVTYDGSLYVCTDGTTNGAPYKPGSPADAGNFLLLVAKGEDGVRGADGRPGQPGPVPNISVRFDGTQLIITDANTGTRLATSADLTGPAWVPALEGHKIVWNKKDANETARPSDIDLDELRPVESHPILFRVDSDNTKRTDEVSGPARFIQWKHEGDEDWTNLISIAELMNLTLVGVSFWQDEDDDNAWHFGHREVIEAHYEATARGREIITNVELGKVLFDAGKVPFPDNSIDIEALNIRLGDLEQEVALLGYKIPDLTPYAKKSEIPTDYVTSVTLNGTNHVPNSNTGVVDLGTISLDTDDCVKSVTIDGETKTPNSNGNVTFTLGDKYNLFELRVNSNNVLQKRVNGGSWEDLGTFDSGSSSGLDDIDFQLNSNTNYLQYRTKEDGSWGSWENIVEIPTGGSGESDGTEYTSATYSNGTLTLVRRNNTNPTVLNITGSSSSTDDDPLVDVELNGNILSFTTREGDIIPITLPSSSSSSGLTEAQVRTLIGRALEGLDVPTEYIPSSNDNYFVRINELNDILGATYATKVWTNNAINTAIQNAAGGNLTITTYRPFSIYTRTASDTETPALPSASDWKWYSLIDNKLHSASDSSVNTVTVTENSKSYIWYNDVPASSASTPYLWVSWNSFADDTGEAVDTWNGPACMTGHSGEDGTDGTNGTNGQDGIDGDTTKFVYKLVRSRSTSAPNVPNATPDAFVDEADTSGVNPTKGWKDNAQGISEEWPVEWYCYAVKTYNTITEQYEWSSWIGPFRWAMWGENGVDGSGVEYIYHAQASGSLTGTTPDDLDPDSGAFQNNDFVPTPSTNPSTTATWTDEPSGVSASTPFEFVSVRKYDGTTKTWGAFSEPKVWAHFAVDGTSGIINNYIIVPSFNNVTKTTVNGQPLPVGRIEFTVQENGDTLTDQSYGSASSDPVCAYLGSYTDNTPLTGSLNSSTGKYTIYLNSQSVNNVSWDDDAPFIQIMWFETNKNGRILDTAIIPMIIPGEDGSDAGTQSLAGKVIDVTEYNSTKTYHNGDSVVNGVNLVDIVLYNGVYYKCIADNITNVPPTNQAGEISASWEPFTVITNAVLDTLLANNAYIQNLTSRQVVVTNSNNAIVAGMTSSSAIANSDLDGYTIGNVRIWAGTPSTTGDLTTAPLTISDQGEIVSQGGTDCNGAYKLKTTLNNGEFTITSTNTSDTTKVASLAFGINCDTGLPYFVLKDFNGNDIWEAGESGFNFSGTIVPQSVVAYPGSGNLYKNVTLDTTDSNNIKINSSSFTHTTTSGYVQYYTIRPGFVIDADNFTIPQVSAGGGEAFGNGNDFGVTPRGWIDPYANTTALVENFNDLKVSGTNYQLDAVLYKHCSNLCAPTSSDLINDGYYITSQQRTAIVNAITTYNSDQSHIANNLRCRIPLIQTLNGRITNSLVYAFYYPDESVWVNASDNTIDILTGESTEPTLN